ncbi:secoisolariciresinol dehydrogenase-like [Cryptomeria japonica]|uniref:secoisolariciresinol dehydrogenase-like n=1 Tax=Cryptomeria japonica TaxID=3369 RepID=UPI0027DA69DC|nr:secoisolariciresinol dehydrogenase-like [Cryptomeria japonica]
MAFSGMRRFEGKVAIVTGGSNGIGAATARKFVAEGAYVYIADIDEEGGVKVCQELHGNASFVKCDVAIETHVKGVVDRAMEEKGRLDIMVNNAGMLHAHGNSITQVSVETWERVMAVNVTGAMLGMKHAARVMIPRNSGSILFNCSVLGLMKTDNASHGYMASKNALLGLMKSGAVELAKVGIRVNAVSSFGIVTKMIEEWLDEVSNGMCPKEVLEDEMQRNATNGRKLTVDDVANAFLFLAADEASYINGHNLIVDGGYSVHGRDIVTFKDPPRH